LERNKGERREGNKDIKWMEEWNNEALVVIGRKF
jgi:hypothetical protein